jgi:hypothetical protein
VGRRSRRRRRPSEAQNAHHSPAQRRQLSHDLSRAGCGEDPGT